MSFSEYAQQLESVKKALETSDNEQEREELLSLKNSIEELLSIAFENEEENKSDESKKIDDEYALFMAEINTEPSSSNQPQRKVESIVELKSLEGKKCKAPHVNEWGGKEYHNAMICSILENELESENELYVKILFTNPTSNQMLPCPFYFDTDCKFSAEKCKYSHGEIVLLSELHDYVEPNFETLEDGSEILAKDSKSKLWKRAKILKISKEKCTIKFDGTKKEVSFDDILPLEKGDEESESDCDSEDCDQDKMEIINMSLMNVPTDGAIGSWEKFTRGIGSKLMQKMGYIIGTGLGKKSDGRIEPVPAVILPAGKSLDHCMNLREKYGGDENFFDAEKKMKKLQKKQEIRNEKNYEKSKQQTDIFNFLNKSLSEINNDSSIASKTSSQHRETIKKETCRNLNVASLKTDENIRKTEKDLFKIRESLKRHNDINSQVHKNLIIKLKSAQHELKQLKNRAQNIKNEQNLRKDKKKMTIF